MDIWLAIHGGVGGAGAGDQCSHSGCLLPGGAVQRGGGAAGQVLLDALVVAHLRGNGDGGGLGPGGHHGGLARRGMQRPAGGEEGGEEGQRCR